jgi:hypothetical protein
VANTREGGSLRQRLNTCTCTNLLTLNIVLMDIVRHFRYFTSLQICTHKASTFIVINLYYVYCSYRAAYDYVNIIIHKKHTWQKSVSPTMKSLNLD